MQLFGFEFKRKPSYEDRPAPVSFVPKAEDDGALVVAAGGSYGTYIDIEGAVKTEAELVTKYREMSINAALDGAIDEIVNEAIVIDDEQPVVELIIDEDQKVSPKLTKIIENEFEDILNILDFNREAYKLFKKWYIDGRLYFHVIIDEKDVASGIKDIRYIDPRKIRKIREMERKKDPSTGSSVVQTKNEYFIFNEKGFNYGSKTPSQTTAATGIKIAKDSIVHITSGETDANGNMVLSYLHKAIRPLNMLRALEDAAVIYTITRAPERRIFYIDVGNLPKIKAEQYLRDLMIRHKNKVVYDSNTGQVKDDRKFTTMLEDYWLPRFAGGRGTEIDTLPGAKGLLETDQLAYFQKNLYKSLNVPNSRLDSENSIYSLGRATEISRDEIRFSKFITRLRNQFSKIFIKLLEKQVVLKGLMSIEEWESQYKQYINFRFNKETYFDELKKLEIMNDRLNLVQQMSLYAGMYYSHEYIRKSILKQTNEEIAEIDSQIKNEESDPKYQLPVAIDPSAQLNPGDTMKDKNKPNKKEN